MQCFIGYFMVLCFFSGAVNSTGWTVNNCDVTFDQVCCSKVGNKTAGTTGCKCRCGSKPVDSTGKESSTSTENLYCNSDEDAWPDPNDKTDNFKGPSCGLSMDQKCCDYAEEKRKSKRIDSSKSSDSDSDTNSHSKHTSSSLSESEELKKKPETSELIPWYSLDTTKLNKLPMSKLRDSNQNTDSESHLHSKGKYTSSLARSKSNDATLKSKKTRDEVQCACRCAAAETGNTCKAGEGALYHKDGLDSVESDEDVIEGSDATKNNGNKLEAIINFINFLFILILFMI